MNEEMYSNNGRYPECRCRPIVINCSECREWVNDREQSDCKERSRCHCCPAIIINCGCHKECQRCHCCPAIIINCQNERNGYMDFANNTGPTGAN